MAGATEFQILKIYNSDYQFDLMEELMEKGHIDRKDALNPDFWKENQDMPMRLTKYKSLIGDLTIHPLFNVNWILKYPYLQWSTSTVSLCLRSLNEIQQLARFSPRHLRFGRCGLSNNRKLKFEWIEAFPNKKWCFSGLDGMSTVPNFSVEWLARKRNIPQLSHKKWHMNNFGISMFCRNLSCKMIDEIEKGCWTDDMQNKLCWGAYGLSVNPSLTLDIIKKFHNRAWDWKRVQANKQFHLEWIPYIPPSERLEPVYHAYAYLRMGAAIKEGFVSSDMVQKLLPIYGPSKMLSVLKPLLPADFTDLYLHCVVLKVVVETVAQYSSRLYYTCPNLVPRILKSVDWSDPGVVNLFNHKFPLPPNVYPSFQLDWIRLYSFTQWHFGAHINYGLSSNRNLDIAWIEAYPDKPWDFGFGGVSSAPLLKLHWILKYPQKPWSPSSLVRHANFTLEWCPELQRLGILSPSWKMRFVNTTTLFTDVIRQRKQRLVYHLWCCKQILNKRFPDLLVAHIKTFLF